MVFLFRPLQYRGMNSRFRLVEASDTESSITGTSSTFLRIPITSMAMPAVSTAAAIDTVSPRNAAVLSAAKTENPVTAKKRGRPFSLKEQRKRFKIDDIRTVLGFTLCQDTGLTHHVSADAAQKLLNGGQRFPCGDHIVHD